MCLQFNVLIDKGYIYGIYIKNEDGFQAGWVAQESYKECLCWGSKIENLVEKHNPYHIFGSKGAFNMKLLEKTTFNRKSGIVGSF